MAKEKNYTPTPVIEKQHNATIQDAPGEVLPQSVVEYEDVYFKKLKESGVDVSVKGSWQLMYAFYLDKIFGIKDKTVIDLGCAMGSIASAFADYKASKSIGVDISKYASEKTPFKNIQFVHANASHIPMIADNSVDFVHSMYMINCLSENEIHNMFEEINRIAKNGALFFAILNLGIESKKNETGLHPKYYYDSIASKFKMQDGARSFYNKLMATYVPGWDFMKVYNWPYLLYKINKE